MNCLCCRDGHEYCECKTIGIVNKDCTCENWCIESLRCKCDCDCGTHEEVIDGTVVYYEKCR